MANIERKFLTELKNSFGAHGAFFYKVPDMPHFKGSRIRFDAEKPFDAFLKYHGNAVAIEAKYLSDFKAFGLRQLRPNQIEGLDGWSNGVPGTAFVFLNIRRKPNRLLEVSAANVMLVFEWTAFKAKGVYKKAELVQYSQVTGKAGKYDVTSFLDDLMIGHSES